MICPRCNGSLLTRDRRAACTMCHAAGVLPPSNDPQACLLKAAAATRDAAQNIATDAELPALYERIGDYLGAAAMYDPPGSAEQVERVAEAAVMYDIASRRDLARDVVRRFGYRHTDRVRALPATWLDVDEAVLLGEMPMGGVH